CGYESDLLILLRPISSSLARDPVGPRFEQIVANVEGVGSEIGYHISRSLRIHEGCPSQTQVIHFSQGSLGKNAPQFADAVVEPVNVSDAENCVVLVGKPYELVSFLSLYCQRFLNEYVLALPDECGGYLEG